MTYIRIKTISGHKYGYLVDTVQTEKGPRQKVKQYLGKVIIPPREKESGLKQGSSKEKFLVNSIVAELTAHGFREKKGNLCQGKVAFSPSSLQLSKGKKEVVIRINDGHLCSHTIQQLRNFRKSEDIKKDGYALATAFLEAGLPVSREEFISFYGLC
ncbi:hypothetical protein COV20_06155 [Candidatus Woesearchaeota archaeon CG10_big_fil_rev_8_21_14_0_10_45_16]|nr:MAG: hypothetical protein COV20_06155 [Candidatus Woesearchaeota archaeon CG10_big_fil_rev_8_21_14_0_10_45_16]